MQRVLLTGMSGVGKSTVAERLSGLGYKVVETDHGGYSVVDEHGYQQWDVDRVRELLATEDADVLFVVGSDDAQVQFYPDFDQIVLLRAPRDIMVERLAPTIRSARVPRSWRGYWPIWRRSSRRFGELRPTRSTPASPLTAWSTKSSAWSGSRRQYEGWRFGSRARSSNRAWRAGGVSGLPKRLRPSSCLCHPASRSADKAPRRRPRDRPGRRGA